MRATLRITTHLVSGATVTTTQSVLLRIPAQVPARQPLFTG